MEIESIPKDLETLNIKLRTLLGISTNEKIRVKYFDKSSSEFINLDKIEQIPTSECILRVFSSNSILSNIRKFYFLPTTNKQKDSIEFSKLDFGTENKSNWKKIGSGGYCDVFLATYSGIEVAVKTFKSNLIDSKEFQKEAKALR